MPFLISFLVLFAILLVTPLIKFACLRLGLRSELKKVCRKQGFTFTPACKRAFLGSRRRACCDFHIETPECVWSVKMIGYATRRVLIRFCDERHVELADHRFRAPKVADAREKDFKPETLPEYDFKFASPKAKKPRRRVYLLTPSVMDHSVAGSKGYIPEGAYVGKINILYPKAFLEILEEVKNGSQEEA